MGSAEGPTRKAIAVGWPAARCGAATECQRSVPSGLAAFGSKTPFSSYENSAWRGQRGFGDRLLPKLHGRRDVLGGGVDRKLGRDASRFVLHFFLCLCREFRRWNDLGIQFESVDWRALSPGRKPHRRRKRRVLSRRGRVELEPCRGQFRRWNGVSLFGRRFVGNVVRNGL